MGIKGLGGHSFVDTSKGCDPTVAWSDQMWKLFHNTSLFGALNTDDMGNIRALFERFLIEMQDEKDKTTREIESLQNRISDLEAMK